jgi:uncharacterized protein YdhG (YjbR/CyaY superfamily)
MTSEGDASFYAGRPHTMKTKQTASQNIDEYIRGFRKEIREILQKIRMTIRKAAPQAEEIISYQMPAFRLNGNLVYFAAFKKHFGFFPTSSGIRAFEQELSAYHGSKGSVQFPFDQPVPFGLITKIVKFRVSENLKKAETKRKKK